jgi:hypothetical protein
LLQEKMDRKAKRAQVRAQKQAMANHKLYTDMARAATPKLSGATLRHFGDFQIWVGVESTCLAETCSADSDVFTCSCFCVLRVGVYFGVRRGTRATPHFGVVHRGTPVYPGVPRPYPESM